MIPFYYTWFQCKPNVYRFGGAELFGSDAENLVFSFFNQLFTKYQRT